jgi:hypothetical protein
MEGRYMKGTGSSFTKGLLVTLGLYLLFFPIALIPLVGPVLAVTLMPYLASALGTRYTDPGERIPLAFTCAVSWSALQTLLIILVMKQIASMSPMGFRLDGMAVQLIILIWIFNTLFTVLGARYPWNDPYRDMPDQ